MDERDRMSNIDDDMKPDQADRSDAGDGIPSALRRYAAESKLSSSDAEQIEWEMDQLVRVMGLHLARRPDSPEWTDAALLEVLTRELREAPPRTDEWPRERVAGIRERILGRVRDARAGLRLVQGRPPLRPASIPASPLVALKEAALERCAVHIDPAVAAGPGREIWDGECDQWVECPPDVPSGDYLSMTVSGDSMVPLLHADDTILVKVSPDVVQGRIVVARDPENRYVVKRVGRLSATRIELLSENPDHDAIVIRRSRGAIVGTVVLRWCAHEQDAARDG